MAGQDSYRDALSGDFGQPLVSVVVAARNEASRIDACLEALQGQDFPGDAFEVFVVDNASTDDTAKRAAAHGVRLVREPRVGIGFARHACIRAARGELVAFLDADSVPDRRWLAELVAGADDPETACFVGEILPLASTSLVAKYVHDRRLICQMRLLSGAPPAAATGSVAYRRVVFATIGLFDESLPGGEDSDLFWRMVRTDRFRVRYNPRAVVAHAHPSRLLEFARRSYREGVALGTFRRKHAEDLGHTSCSRLAAAAALARIVAGMALYPLRVWRSLRIERQPLPTAFVYPLLDKVSSAARVGGIVRALSRRRALPIGAPVAGSDLRGIGGRRPPASTIDRLELDLEGAPLLSADEPDLRDRVRRELWALAHGIQAVFPASSIVLTGSLFVGEGRVARTPQGLALASDYDLFVVTPHPPHALPSVARRKLDHVMRAVGPLVAAADIGFVWRPLVRHRKTTLGGAVIGGSKKFCELLPPLPAPCGVSTLLHAYAYLTAAPLDLSQYPELCAKALVRAARALLLADKWGRPRREWIEFSSIDVVRERLDDWRPVLGSEVVEAVGTVGNYLLGRSSRGPQPQDHASHCAILRSTSARMRTLDSKVVATKHILWLMGPGRGRSPVRLGSRPLLEALRTLAESWSPDGPLRAEYATVQRRLWQLVTFNPHRFVYVRRGAQP